MKVEPEEQAASPPPGERAASDGSSAARALGYMLLAALTVIWSAAAGALGWDGLVALGLVLGPIAVGLLYLHAP